MKRYLSLDILKAVGIIYLIILHHTVWMFIQGDVGGLIFPEAHDLVYNFYRTSGLGVLGFQVPILAGVTFYLMLHKKNMSWTSVVKRAAGLSILGFLMNGLAWGWGSLWTWDVLQFIPLSMVIAYPFLRWRKEDLGCCILLVLSIVALVFADQFPFGRQFADYYFYKVIIGDLSGSNYWALCPWFSIFVCGIFMGKFFFLHERPKTAYWILLGAVFLLSAVVSGKFLPNTNLDHIWGPFLFKPSILYVVGIMGFSLIAVSGTHFLLQQYPVLNDKLQKSWLIYYSKGILWIYIVSTIAGYHGTNIVRNYFALDFSKSIYALIILISLNLLLSYHIGKFVSRQKA